LLYGAREAARQTRLPELELAQEPEQLQELGQLELVQELEQPVQR
jgi:hypothetical protein